MKKFWVVVAIVLVVIAAFAIGLWWYLPVPHNSPRYTAQYWTVYAQVFGGIVGTLVAALAFAGLIYTALMQREELSLQRDELRENRGELKRTADAHTALVEAAQLSARITAMTTLMNYYQLRSSDLYGSTIANEARSKVPEIARDIEILLAEGKSQRTPEG